MAIIPVIRELKLQEEDSRRILTTHLQMFNTHPYFSASIIGSIVRLEEGQACTGEDCESPSIKQSFMASYAAIGDIFFWGALRPFASILTALLIFTGLTVAPVIFLLIYTPVHLWIRIKGFAEGYKSGKTGFEFIRSMDLPKIAVKIRWAALITLSGILVWLAAPAGYWPFMKAPGIIMKLTALAVVLLCWFMIKKGISQMYIIYGALVVFLVVSWKGFLI